MGSLFAGPRAGMFAYTEDKIEVGHTFYIAFLVEKRRIKERGIVEITGIFNGIVKVEDTENKKREWFISVYNFLRTANLFTDIEGNPFYERSKKKWWQFW